MNCRTAPEEEEEGEEEVAKGTSVVDAFMMTASVVGASVAGEDEEFEMAQTSTDKTTGAALFVPGAVITESLATSSSRKVERNAWTA